MWCRDKLLIEAKGASRGFSLVEVLVSVGVSLAICGLIFGSYQAAMQSCAKAQDVAAGKTLISAFHKYAAENDGNCLVGYLKGAQPVELPDGTKAGGEAANRYVWRLAPYFDFATNGIIYGKNRRVSNEASFQASESGYGQSLMPNYGMNAFYVGGYFEEGQSAVPIGDVVRRLGDVSSSSQLIVFATACSPAGPGNFLVKAPRFIPRSAASAPLPEPDWPKGASPAATGFVDFRHSGRALCAFMDGSVRPMELEAITDMRLWSKNAAASNNPNYAPTLEGGSGGRR